MLFCSTAPDLQLGAVGHSNSLWRRSNISAAFTLHAVCVGVYYLEDCSRLKGRQRHLSQFSEINKSTMTVRARATEDGAKQEEKKRFPVRIVCVRAAGFFNYNNGIFFAVEQQQQQGPIVSTWLLRTL